MPALHAEVQVAGHRAICTTAQHSLFQRIAHTGQPTTDVLAGLVKLTFTGEEAFAGIWRELAVDSYRHESGHVGFFHEEGHTFRRLTFYDAYCVHYQFRFDARGQNGQASVELDVYFAPATLDLDGTRIENYSKLWWEKDHKIRFNALNKPPELLPSPRLRASFPPASTAPLISLVDTGVLKAEELAAGLLKRVITPAGEVATEFLGVGLTAIARAASLTAGLVLTPTNDPNSPGYAPEKNFTKDHPSQPPDFNKIRLAELERLREQRTLTADEEAELIALLAKVRGVRIQSLEELGPLPPRPSSHKPSKPYKNKKKFLGDGPSKEESKRLQYLGRTPGKGSSTGKEVVRRMESEGKIRESELPPGREVLGPDGKWHDIRETDMGHIEDAVNWWNTQGRNYSPKGKEVRKWMLDPNNYELEPSSINRSRGAKLKQKYLPPLE